MLHTEFRTMDKRKTVALFADFSDADVSSEVLRKLIDENLTDKSIKLRDESVYGRIILKYLLSEYFGMKDFIISTDEKGKPYLVGSNLRFNISHSMEKVFCAVSTDEVGCDVERIRDYKAGVAKRFYSADECIILSDSEKKQEDFTKLWTLKEAVLKKKGLGISGGLSQYSFSRYIKSESFTAYGLCFDSFKKDGFYYAICSETDDISVSEVDIKDIIENLM